MTPQPQAAPAAAPAAPAAPAQPGGEQGKPFERIVLAAAKIIYSPGVSEQLLKMMQSAETPQRGVYLAMKLVFDKLQESGMPPQVTDRLAPVVGGLVIELGVTAGVLNPEEFKNNGAPQMPAEPEEKEGEGIVAKGMGG